MLQTRLLLVAPSTMTGSPAFERAAALARVMQLPLHIVAFDYVQALVAAGAFAAEHIRLARDGYVRTHRQWLKQKAALIGKHGLQVTSEVVWVDNPYEEILHFVNEMPFALIVKDAQEDTALKRVFLTPLDWQLLCAFPTVHLVTSALNPKPRNVLAIVNLRRNEEEGRALNDQVIDAALRLSDQCAAQLELVHAYDWTALYAQDLGSGALPLATGIYQAWGVAQYGASVALAERRGVPAAAQHFIEGPPLPCVVDFAAEHCTDVIVFGVTEQNGLNKLPGASAEQLLHRAPCSILAITAGR